MILGVILISIAPLLHKVFSKTNPKVDSYKKELALSITTIDNKLINNRCNLENNIIEKVSYLHNLDRLNVEKEVLLKRNEKVLKEFIDYNRFFGWRTKRDFVVGLGVRLPYLLLSFIISYLVYKIRDEDKFLRKWFFWLQISCYSISFYFMFWVFWTSQDFPLKTYRWLFILFSILGSIATVAFITYREIFKLKASKRIEKLITLLLTNNKYIESDKNAIKNIKENVEKIEEVII